MRKEILITCVLLYGCTAASSSHQTGTAILGYNGISEAGIYHLVTNDSGSLVYFYDREADMDVPLCNRPNCEHNDPSCNAAALTTYDDKRLSTPPMYVGNCLYLCYENTSTLENVLCTAKQDGSDRKEYMKLPNDILVSAIIEDDLLYMTFNGMERDENGMITGTGNEYKNYIASLSDKKINEIKSDPTTALYYLGSVEDTVYAQAVSALADGSYRTDLVTVEEDGVKNKAEGVPSLSHLIGKYAYWDNDGMIMQYDVTTGEQTEYWRPMEDTYKVRSIANDGLMTMSCPIGEEDHAVYYADLLKKEMIETTERPVAVYDGEVLTAQEDGKLHKRK